MHWPHRQSVENPSVSTLSTLASLGPQTRWPLPPTSPLSIQYQDQSDLKRIILGTDPQCCILGISYLTSLVRNISGLDHCNHLVSCLFWWWATSQALFFPSCTHAKHHQKFLSPQQAEGSMGDVTSKQCDTGELSFRKLSV